MFYQNEHRAEQLLLSFLDEGQIASWRAYRSFEITTKAGNRYRLTSSSVVPLATPLNAGYGYSYCLIPRDGRLPVADQVLARMLLLQSDEGEFLSRAVRWPTAPFQWSPAAQWTDRGELVREPPVAMYTPAPDRPGRYLNVAYGHTWSLFDDGLQTEMTVDFPLSDLADREDRDDWRIGGRVQFHGDWWRVMQAQVGFAPLGYVTFTLVAEVSRR